jgi:hypothetical protein
MDSLSIAQYVSECELRYLTILVRTEKLHLLNLSSV